MSERANALADRFEQACRDLLLLLRDCTDEQWQLPCTDEERPIGVVAHHVSGAMMAGLGWLHTVAHGQQLPPLTQEMIDQLNAEHALKHAARGREETIAGLERNAGAVAEAIRALDDEQLERTGWMPLFGEQPLSGEQIIKFVIIRHVLGHTRSIRATLQA